MLCLALIKLFGSDFEKIKEEIAKYDKSNDFTIKICRFIVDNRLNEPFYYEKLYQYYKNVILLYNFLCVCVLYDDFINQKANQNDNPEKTKINDISSLFYEGLDIDLDHY